MTELMYGELAPWWPLLSPPDEYAEEAAFATTLLGSASGGVVRDVLELGSGGGNVASYLVDRFAMTLVDRSEAMLDVSRALNPDAAHVLGDMRDVRLGRAFDAVFVHDAITYLTTEDELHAAMTTAFVHCRPGGVAVLVPDFVAETFGAESYHGGVDGDDGRSARYLLWSVDPDSSDTWYETHVAYLLRHADGRVEHRHETHRRGLFSRETWLRLLADAGFEAEVAAEVTTDDRPPRDFLVGRRAV